MLATLNLIHVKAPRHSLAFSLENNAPFVLIATSTPQDLIPFAISGMSLFRSGSPSPEQITLFRPLILICLISLSMISLSRKGKKAYSHHEQFHEQMIQATLAGMDEAQTEVLVHALQNLKDFFMEYGKK